MRVFQNDSRFSHFCQAIFQHLAQRARLRKWPMHHSTRLIIHDFAQFVKLKSKKNEKIPKFLEILTQRAVGCQIKLTIPLLMIHELSNFVKFFVKKIVPFRFSIGKMLS